MSTWMRLPAQVWSPAPPAVGGPLALPLSLPLLLQPGDQLHLNLTCFNPGVRQSTLSLTGIEQAVADPDALQTASDPGILPETAQTSPPLPRTIPLLPGQRRTLSLALHKAEAPVATLGLTLHSGRARTMFQQDVPVARARRSRLNLQPSQPTLEQRLVEHLELIRTASGPGARARLTQQEESWKVLEHHRQVEGGWGWLPESPADAVFTARVVLMLSLCAVPVVLQPLRIHVLEQAARWLLSLEAQLSPFGNAELLAQMMAATSAFRRLLGPAAASGSDTRALAMLFSRAPKASNALQAHLALAAWCNSELSIAEQVLRWMSLPTSPETDLKGALLQQLSRVLIQPKAEATVLLKRRLSLCREDDRVVGPEVASLFKLLEALPAPGSLGAPPEAALPTPERTLRWSSAGVLLHTSCLPPHPQKLHTPELHTPELHTPSEPPVAGKGLETTHIATRLDEDILLTVLLFVPESLERVMLVLTPPAGLLPVPDGLDSHLLELPLADLGEAWNELWLARASLDATLLETRFRSIPPDLDVAHTARYMPLISRWEEGQVWLAVPSLPLGIWRLRLRLRAAFLGVFCVPPAVLWSEPLPWMEARGPSGTLHILPKRTSKPSELALQAQTSDPEAASGS